MTDSFFLNGEQRPLDRKTLGEVLAAEGVADLKGGVAVACNGEVVPRSEWAQTPVNADDRIEIVHIVRGG